MWLLQLKNLKKVLLEGSKYKSLLVTTRKMIHLFKKIFFPSFVYKFATSLPSVSYIEKVAVILESFGAKILAKKSDTVTFYISAHKIQKLSWGKLLIHIRKSEAGDYNFRIEFVRQKITFYFGVILLSLFILISVIASGSITELFAIPFIFMSGHIYFLGVPLRITKIKRFLMNLDDGNGPLIS
jgi:hypothetical protein